MSILLVILTYLLTAFRKDGGTKQRSIHMEYLPESNSVLKLELTENDLPRKITQSNFTIGEFMKKRFRITVHQGSFEDTLINVQTIKLRPDKMKLWNENKDNLVSFWVKSCTKFSQMQEIYVKENSNIF